MTGKMARLDEEEKLRNELLESLGHAERSYGSIPVYAPTGGEKGASAVAVKPEASEVTGLDAGHLRMRIGDGKLKELEREAARLIGGRYAELRREESTLLSVLDDSKQRLMQQEAEMLRSRLDALEESTDNLMRHFEGAKRPELEARKERLKREVEWELRRKLAELEQETSSLMRQMELEFRSAIRTGAGRDGMTSPVSVFRRGPPPEKVTGFPDLEGSKPRIKVGSWATLEVPAKAGFDGMLGRLFSHAGSTASRGEIYDVSNKLEKLFTNVARTQIELGLQRDLIGRAEEREARMLESISELRSLALQNELALMALKAKIGGP